MKKAKKIIMVFAILLALVLGTAKIVVAIISLNEPSPSSEVKEPIQLTHSSEYEDGEFVQTKRLKTEEGIEISCSDNYVMGEATNNSNDEFFWYDFSDAVYEAESYLEKDFDQKVTFSSSNAKIIKIEYYYFNYDKYGLERISDAIKIDSETITDNKAVVDRYYNEKHIDQIKLYFEGENTQIYYAIFEIAGK